jgi:septum formation protein
MNPPPLILASASPRRSQLLRELEFEFAVVPSDAEETDNTHLTARELAQINAYRKARSVAKRHPEAVVLGCDTVVYLDGRPYGKPRDLDDARRMLGELSGRRHEVVSGCCLMHLDRHQCDIFADATEVVFRPLTDGQIGRYLSSINPLDKAGAYAIQENGEMIVEAVFGSLTNVVGLPTERLCRRLKAFGIG